MDTLHDPIPLEQQQQPTSAVPTSVPAPVAAAAAVEVPSSPRSEASAAGSAHSSQGDDDGSAELADLLKVMKGSNAFESADRKLVQAAISECANRERLAKLKVCAGKIDQLTAILTERTDVLNRFTPTLEANPALRDALVQKQALIIGQLNSLKEVYAKEQSKLK
jgi:hypothetical protein